MSYLIKKINLNDLLSPLNNIRHTTYNIHFIYCTQESPNNKNTNLTLTIVVIGSIILVVKTRDSHLLMDGNGKQERITAPD